MNLQSNLGSTGRRRFLRHVAAATALRAGTMFCACGMHGALAANEVAASQVGSAGVVDPRKGYLVLPIRDGLHWITDGAYSTMFLVASAGVIACDAPPTLGTNYLKAIAEVTDRPVTHL